MAPAAPAFWRALADGDTAPTCRVSSTVSKKCRGGKAGSVSCLTIGLRGQVFIHIRVLRTSPSPHAVTAGLGSVLPRPASPDPDASFGLEVLESGLGVLHTHAQGGVGGWREVSGDSRGSCQPPPFPLGATLLLSAPGGNQEKRLFFLPGGAFPQSSPSCHNVECGWCHFLWASLR